MAGCGERVKTPVQVVMELYEAMRDARIEDMLELVDPEVTCAPVHRPAVAEYRGHEGMTRLTADMHAAHGQYKVEIAEAGQDDESQVTVQAWIVPQPGRGPQFPVRSVYRLHNGWSPR
jgi:hypothetical protein